MSTNNNDDDNDTGGEIGYMCKGCGRVLSGPNEKPCSNCGSPLREIIAVKNERVSIKEKLRREMETEKRNYRWFILTLIVTISAPFITAYLDRITGIIVGIGFGLLSFRLGKRAYTIIRRIYESE
jgi:CRISPR/Cas system-associated protein Cas10 (large subunit of type III CRISPR-Cas system)